MALRESGFAHTIQLVENGQEAIAYMMGEGKYADRALFAYPCFILTDLDMPGGDGFALLEHLQTNRNWSVVPTIVLSASADPDDIKRAYLLGASAYHVKPHGYAALCQLLKLVYEYWVTSAVPERDPSGCWVTTDSTGKLGARFGPEPSGAQQRVRRGAETLKR